MQRPEPPKALVAALRRLLRPLVRGLIANGITVVYLNALLKRVYVDVARDFRVEGKNLTDSRVSLITGVHRKDVKRLRHESRDGPAPSKYLSTGAQVVGHWTGLPRYLDDAGRPKALPRSGPESFDALVESVSKDVRPRTILDEWLSRGVVSVDDDDRVHLHTEAFVPSREFDDLAYYYGRNLHDHIAAATRNLHGHKPAFLERSVYYNRLTAESVAELEKLARNIGMDALMELNREALRRAEADDGKPDATERMNFGLYFFREDESAGEGDAGGEDRP